LEELVFVLLTNLQVFRILFFPIPNFEVILRRIGLFKTKIRQILK
jgi:hypothetical protein